MMRAMRAIAGAVVGMMVLAGCGSDGDGVSGDADSGQLTDPSAATVTEAGSDPSGDPTDDGSVGGVCDGATHSGEGTYYGADGSGNCSFDAAPGDPLVAAMNDADYAGAGACGACVEVTGPDATIVVRVVDRCPECPAGDIDFSEAAFAMIAKKELGRVPITWQYVSCPVSGSLAYRFKEGSSGGGDGAGRDESIAVRSARRHRLQRGGVRDDRKKELGRVPITWQYVSCPVSGSLAYRFKEGSSQLDGGAGAKPPQRDRHVRGR
jgi:expansin (peptidoglycan-binding protein)